MCFLTEYFLNNIHPHLSPNQKFYAAVSFEDEHLTAWFVEGGNVSIRQPEPTLSSNSEETDARIWLHARRTEYTHVLILSLDMGVYFIGLPLQCNEEEDIILQINKVNSRELRLLHLKMLIHTLKSEPKLSNIESNTFSR